jgi:hypothetical protein
MEEPTASVEKRKRHRRTKAEIAEERELLIAAETYRQSTEERIEEFLGAHAGNKLFKVRSKPNKRIVQHRILVDHRKHIFFVDHGWCVPRSLIGELELKNMKHDRQDACYIFAMHVILGTLERGTFSKDIPDPYSMHRGYRDDYTNNMAEWWDRQSFDFLRALKATRSSRAHLHIALTDPINAKIPFTHSAAIRVESCHGIMKRRIFEKLDRVKQRLQDKKYPPSGRYYNINETYCF